MKPSVSGIMVFTIAVRTHGKVTHRGLRPIIGNGSDDGKTGSAVGAVDKRIAETTIVRVDQFMKTVVTKSNVGRDHGSSHRP